MADNSKIEWTDASWNPIRARNLKTGKVGWHCEHATTGCEFCYSEGFNKRLGTGLPFKPGHRKDIEIFLDEQMLRMPVRWKKPRKIFVGSMTDLFADFVTDEMLFEIFSVMGACEDQGLGHEFQVLTKRADRMRQWVTAHGSRAWNSCRLGPKAWPARNVWLGVSAERQQEADERIPDLLATPAAVRFVSAEPLLDRVDLTRIGLSTKSVNQLGFYTNALVGHPQHSIPRLDQVIGGGESGAKARPMHPDWPRAMRDQCAAADVAFFFKQWGMFAPLQGARPVSNGGPLVAWPDGFIGEGCAERNGGPGEQLFRGTKEITGRLLDGVEHNAFPKVPA